MIQRFLSVRALLPLMLVLAAGTTVLAQADDWPPVSYLRHDFRDSAVVAHVAVHDAAVVHKIGGYEDWRLTGTVKKTFKGKVRRGPRWRFTLQRTPASPGTGSSAKNWSFSREISLRISANGSTPPSRTQRCPTTISVPATFGR